jgi:hypothetical protein
MHKKRTVQCDLKNNNANMDSIPPLTCKNFRDVSVVNPAILYRRWAVATSARNIDRNKKARVHSIFIAGLIQTNYC